MPASDDGRRAEHIRASAQQLVDGLTPLTDAEAMTMAVMSPQDLAQLRDRVTAAKKTVEALAAAIS